MSTAASSPAPGILVLGAAGGIARLATDMLVKETEARLTLYLRKARRLKRLESDRMRVIEGDVLDPKALIGVSNP